MLKNDDELVAGLSITFPDYSNNFFRPHTKCPRCSSSDFQKQEELETLVNENGAYVLVFNICQDCNQIWTDKYLHVSVQYEPPLPPGTNPSILDNLDDVTHKEAI